MSSRLKKTFNVGIVGAFIPLGIIFFLNRSPGNDRSAAAAVERQPHERGQLLILRYQCLSCHRLNGVGNADGIDLSCTGEKVKLEWLRSFLKKPADHSLRRLDYTMPNFQFSDQEVEDLVAFFAKNTQSSVEEKVDPCRDPQRVQEGKALFQAYGCQSCHRVGNEKFKTVGNFFEGAKHETVTRHSPDLRHASRLNRTWAIDFMEKPGRFLPGTPMFNNGVGRSSLEKIFDYLTNPELAGADK